MDDLSTVLAESLRRHSARNAIRIGSVFHTYKELGEAVDQVRIHVRHATGDQVIGLMAHDHLLTYAAILALWAEGRAYLPLAPGSPIARNEEVLEQAGVRTVLSCCDDPGLRGATLVRIDGELPSMEMPVQHFPGTTPAYLLYTSGSTGKPKGVPISRAAVSAFVVAFDALGLDLGPDDRCLQMFELTFDLSVMSYLVPFLKGACVYTIPRNEIKYTYIHELLEDQQLTIALMVPSILNFLRPYFDEIQCPSLRANLFCGEALPLDLVDEWQASVPNARILNVYGPTEHTIFCTSLEYRRQGGNKAINGILAIGKPMEGTTVAIIDGEGNAVPNGIPGELYLAGAQATAGYWNDPGRNRESFVRIPNLPQDVRYYRTGDRCVQDEDGDLLFQGRVDHQVKVQGFRVELAEVEHHAKGLLSRRNMVVVAVRNASGNTELVLVTEGAEANDRELVRGLKDILPGYMVPSRVLHMATLPLNANGKIDRPAVAAWAGNSVE